MLNFDLQNHKPLREIVYEELKRQILKGEIAPGHRMMEVELADDMGVSRTPVREAIRKLEKEGLVTIEPRKGAYASDISIKEMIDVLDCTYMERTVRYGPFFGAGKPPRTACGQDAPADA